MKKFLKGFIYAWNGIRYAFRSQVNFRFHTGAIVCVVIAGIYYKLSVIEWLWIGLAIMVVLMSELFNTAIETLLDILCPEYNKQVGLAKDLASAAVLVAAIFAFITGIVIFIPKIF